MLKLLKYLFVGVVVSFYFFSFEFSFLPGVNTKMMLAVAGVIFFIIYLVKKKEFVIPKSILMVLALSCVVSLIGLFSTTFNQTEDYTYASYIVSASIWMSAAFAVCCVIYHAHGRIDVPLVVNYLVAVSVFQCAMAMLIEFIPAVRVFVDRWVRQGQLLLQSLHRLYGIGASLDVAGSKFSVVLVCISFLIINDKRKVSTGLTLCYWMSFFVITVIGNMIARTTLIGSLIGLFVIVLFFIVPSSKESSGKNKVFLSLLLILSVLLPLAIGLYKASPAVNKLYRFAFEGFFNLAEKGEWSLSSTDKLQTMVVFPETLKTWIIGDGYFLNSRYDSNYVGNATDQGFYMGTDVGYLRFIFYFGIIGLIAIASVMIYTAFAAASRDKENLWVFLLTLLVGLIVWVKVSTDVFLGLVLFLIAVEMRIETESDDSQPESQEDLDDCSVESGG